MFDGLLSCRNALPRLPGQGRSKLKDSCRFLTDSAWKGQMPQYTAQKWKCDSDHIGKVAGKSVEEYTGI